jgi:hypothetical protein
MKSIDAISISSFPLRIRARGLVSLCDVKTYDGADTSQVILFNRLQSSRDADSALLAERTSGIESRLAAALL